MPTYNYICIDNDHACSESRKMTEDQIITCCPECGSQLKRDYSAPGIQFVGSGFYKTDH
jgi:putative FmdB family regulatory protein